jgi:Bacterial regulatory proteins, gntR family
MTSFRGSAIRKTQMNSRAVNSVAAGWARLGVMLNVPPARRTPDLERLILDTARSASANSRLFVLAASWLARYGDYVARHRLARLISDELEEEHRPTLGFLLEWARKNGVKSKNFRSNLPMKACKPADVPRPLTDIEHQNPVFSRLSKERASALSLKWGRWMSEFEIKEDALRPAEWIAQHNPSLRERALCGGDLMASILAECESDPRAIESESELARRCGGSRPALREALRRLRLAGLIHTAESRRATSISLIRPNAA